MTNTILKKMAMVKYLLIVISLFLLGCSSTLNINKLPDDFIEKHIEERLEIAYQVEGVFIFFLEIEIGLDESKVKNLRGKTSNNLVYEELSNCLELIASNKYKGTYQLRIKLDFILNEYMVKILTKEKGIPPQKPTD
jgi:hypothetical protein